MCLWVRVFQIVRILPFRQHSLFINVIFRSFFFPFRLWLPVLFAVSFDVKTCVCGFVMLCVPVLRFLFIHLKADNMTAFDILDHLNPIILIYFIFTRLGSLFILCVSISLLNHCVCVSEIKFMSLGNLF